MLAQSSDIPKLVSKPGEACHKQVPALGAVLAQAGTGAGRVAATRWHRVPALWPPVVCHFTCVFNMRVLFKRAY